MLGSKCRRGSAGFTLVELLVGLALLGLVAVAIASISLVGAVRTSDDAEARHTGAVQAQQVALVFARDVQGATSIAPPCPGTPGDRVVLVTLVPSDGSAPVEYQRSATEPWSLDRVECGAGGQVVRGLADDLADEPVVTCDGSACDVLADPTPRQVSLDVDRSTAFDFELDGARRMTDDNSTTGPLEVPDFVALGGSTPLSIGGSSRLTVDGTVYINAPSTGNTAVDFNGGGRLEVTGDFALQQGGNCPECTSRANKQPGTYPDPLPDPLRFLPAPDPATLTVRTDCLLGTVDGEQRRICQPGVYAEFPPTGGPANVKDYVLQPGVYYLQNGMKVTNGSLRGRDVTFYNAAGQVDIQGGDFDLSAPDSGTYARILLFQARANSAQIKINGNGTVAVLNGTIYAPGSTGVLLGAGTADLKVGRIIGTSLSTTGSGEVTVVGS